MKISISLLIISIWSLYSIAQTPPCTNPPVISITPSNNTICEGDSIILTATGADIYNWSNGIENGVPFVPTVDTVYTVSGTDSIGCTNSASISITVQKNPLITAHASSSEICLGDSILLWGEGGISYNWDLGISNNGYFNPSQIGGNIFQITGTDLGGCSNFAQIVVLVRDVPSPPIVSENEISTCKTMDFETKPIATYVTDEIGWYTDYSLSHLFSNTDTLSPKYDIEGEFVYYAATYKSGCKSSPIEVKVIIHDLPNVELENELDGKSGEEVILKGIANEHDSLFWTPSEYLNNPYSLNPELTITQNETYVLHAKNEFGCIDSSAINIVVNALQISNLITPNNDGNNDTWKIFPLDEIKTCPVHIYDGNGSLVFETTEYKNQWDGSNNGKALIDGVYYYQISCEEEIKSGTISLIR